MAEPFLPVDGFDAEVFLGLLQQRWSAEIPGHIEVIKIEGDRILIDLKQSTNEMLPDIFIPIVKEDEDDKESKKKRAAARSVVQHLQSFADKGKVPKTLVEQLMKCVDYSDRSLMLRSLSLKRQLRTWLLEHPPPAKK
jgi:hypothetical protein